ncbi:unnamed protein product [Durusdinium trenchii]|uniref:Uncharacterized protein n=2 Tax=Durusdinium trenchii TaxID=1381693 RepID=A0ABP0SL32_9DINO
MVRDPQSAEKSPAFEVDMQDLPAEQRSSEDIYWEALWKATKDMMRDVSAEGAPRLEMELLPEIPGSLDMPLP